MFTRQHQPRRRPTKGIAISVVLFLLQSLFVSAQFEQAACLYLDDAFGYCWRRRAVVPYTAPAVAECVCTLDGAPDPLIDSAVPSCSSFLEYIGDGRRATAYYSSFNGYCSSYGDDSGITATGAPESTITASPKSGRKQCVAIIGRYGACQRSPDDLITQAEVASCLCHNPQGDFTTGFDKLLTPCYNWASSAEPDFASEISEIFDFCTRFGTYSVSTQATDTITSRTPTRTRHVAPTLSFSQIENPASSACETLARIANACRTGPLDPLTRVGVANCICQDPASPSGGFETEFDDILMRCYPYAKTMSPAAARQLESLSGYCLRFADGASTYTVTSTDASPTQTVTDDVFVSTTGADRGTNLPAETSASAQPNSADRITAGKLHLIVSALVAVAFARIW
ncbi:hypothetical protein Dda_3480 [Drechslerella dactyloides]|uniref:Uncharacterized protein n=1 Tax=Drechslerella dactyloides TaxID=74499 RepID=A0AAD6J1F4_DREDA|nr:hypothetical protein Dda_3480 [Drechslerella dactyloides]